MKIHERSLGRKRAARQTKPVRNADKIKEAEKQLARLHPELRPIIRSRGPCPLGPKRFANDFEALARSIVFQQLTGAVGNVLYERVKELCGGEFDAERLARMRRDRLRRAGLSNAKTDSMKALAQATVSGVIDFRQLRKSSDETVVEQVTVVKGIGPWTAQMFLMFQLGRLDVWPTTDYGVQKGMTRLLKKRSLLTPKQMIKVGEPYAPYRSVAAWYAWRVVDTLTPGDRR
jgi:DNA-3-methyladenine glycosylase II